MSELTPEVLGELEKRRAHYEQCTDSIIVDDCWACCEYLGLLKTNDAALITAARERDELREVVDG